MSLVNWGLVTLDGFVKFSLVEFGLGKAKGLAKFSLFELLRNKKFNIY